MRALGHVARSDARAHESRPDDFPQCLSIASDSFTHTLSTTDSVAQLSGRTLGSNEGAL